MFFANDIIASVDRVARIRYINKVECRRWNEHRRDGELRLLTGWCWTARNGSAHQQGLKTMSAAYRDAWYVLVQRGEAPSIGRPRLVRAV